LIVTCPVTGARSNDEPEHPAVIARTLNTPNGRNHAIPARPRFDGNRLIE
jgi:hypothetical protein